MRLDSRGRRIPKRTAQWNINIGKALDKTSLKSCVICGTTYRCHRYRKDSSKYCSRQCAGKAIKGKENKAGQKPKVLYNGIHMWTRRWIPAVRCEQCGVENVTLHRANISKQYLRDLSDWRVLCVPCHSEFDGHVKIPNASNQKIIDMRQSGMTFDAIATAFSVSRKAIEKRYYRVTNEPRRPRLHRILQPMA
jgi:hypothetical protein